MFRQKFQEDYVKRARKIQLAIIKEICNFKLVEHLQNRKLYKITFINLKNETKIIYLSYKINKFKYFFQRFNK